MQGTGSGMCSCKGPGKGPASRGAAAGSPCLQGSDAGLLQQQEGGSTQTSALCVAAKPEAKPLEILAPSYLFEEQKTRGGCNTGLPLCIYSCSRNLPVQVGLRLKRCLRPQFMGVLWSHQPRTPLSWPGALQGSPRVLGGRRKAGVEVTAEATLVSAAREALLMLPIPCAIPSQLPPLTCSIYRTYEKCLLPNVRRGMNTPVCHMFC